MANQQAVTTSFKTEIMQAVHALGTAPARSAGKDVFKAALFLASASLGAGTQTYSSTGELSGGGYVTGGVTVQNTVEPANSGTTAFWTPSANLNYGTITGTAFDAVLFYNSSQANKSVMVNTFGSQTISAGNFTLTMPVNDSATALLRIA